MAKVVAKVIGGDVKEIEVGTVGDLKRQMGVDKYTATVNGEPVSDTYALSDFDYVSLAPAVKGA